MSAFNYHAHTLYGDQLPISEIIRSVGSPAYLYSLTQVRANYRRLASAFKPLHAHLHYSLKANANLAIIKALLSEGAGLDAVSGGEVYKGVAVGANPAAIVFAGVGKTVAELEYALKIGVGCYNAESIGELERLNDLAGRHGVKATVALRLNPDVQANTHKNIATGHATAKFGIAHADALDALGHPDRYPHLNLSGLHLHIGSQLGSVEETVEAARHALTVFAQFPQLSRLNMGGGFPVAYTAEDEYPPIEAFAEALIPLLADRVAAGLHFGLEPGRSIVANSGILVMEVQYVKEVNGQRVVITDAGMTELIRPMLYQATHRITPLTQRPGDPLRTAQVVGPICESTDVMGVTDLPESIRPGDLLAVHTIGAYGATMGSTYNARPRPPEIMIEGDQWWVARRRETWEELISQERD
jgi:diaminopimelate decarboxylase